jgi:hypothetical protein
MVMNAAPDLLTYCLEKLCDLASKESTYLDLIVIVCDIAYKKECDHEHVPSPSGVLLVHIELFARTVFLTNLPLSFSLHSHHHEAHIRCHPYHPLTDHDWQ